MYRVIRNIHDAENLQKSIEESKKHEIEEAKAEEALEVAEQPAKAEGKGKKQRKGSKA